jgi:hypothetical protein
VSTHSKTGTTSVVVVGSDGVAGGGEARATWGAPGVAALVGVDGAGDTMSPEAATG